jgi:preprotein translocase subunit SecA
MLNIFANLFDENKKKLDQYSKIVAQINALEPTIKKLSDEKLAAQTAKFKKIIATERQKGTTDQTILNTLLPEAFATVREVSHRVMNLRHFDVQLIAGIALHYGTVTEQRTGEGKTLTVTAPLYLNALLGKGAHLVTVNDYLAELGAGWMGPIYHFLGLTTAVIVHDQSKRYNPAVDSEERGDERLEHWEMISRREAYGSDITYGTNNEFGFDYLRDNMVQRLTDMAQREAFAHYFAIVDEADSILIDEARTPLIISAPDADPTKKYYEYAKLVESLDNKSDYTVDEKSRSVSLTDLGVKRLERKLNITNLYEESFDMIHHIEAALKAKTIFHRDKDYIVRENQVIIVDEHTGRLMYGRRYSDGLHQAIEAKENVPIQQESRTLATISIQNYFRQYEKLSGMTGTASTEAEEFEKIYKTLVLVVPTHRAVTREDKPDIVYKTTAAKYSAIVREIEELHKEGRPILVGTRSISNNQVISEFLRRKNITHQALNAKNHEKEAFIIADAGKPGAITVATNIAGRGVDIVLGGSKPELKDYRTKSEKQPTTSQEERARTHAAELKLQLPPATNPARYDLKAYKKALDEWQAAHDKVVELGGLYIIGSERHESRRIDNQLRGRSGRQGDPGTTQFFVSLEDEIMRLFGGEQISKLMDFLKIDEGQPIEHGMISKSIESAQVKVEGFFFDQRKRVVEFDDVMNKQREIIYKRRRQLLEQAALQDKKSAAQSSNSLSAGSKTKASSTTDEAELELADGLKHDILEYITEEITSLTSLHAPQEFSDQEFLTIVKEFSKVIPLDDASQERLAKSLSDADNIDDIRSRLIEIAEQAYESKEQQSGDAQMRQLELAVSLSTVDEQWMNHLDAMESLREGIWLRGDKKTVLSAYKKEAFQMFDALINQIESTIANRIFRAHFQQMPQMTVIPQKNLIEHKDDINEELAKEVADATLPAAAERPASQKGSSGDLAAALRTAKATAQPKPGIKREKISRNEPCPCGSGLKYKKCGLIGAAQHRE